MAAFNSSSLSFSDGMKRHSSGLLNNTKERMSKQQIMGKAMFGSKFGSHGKDLKVGKKFKKVGKGIMKGATSGDTGSIGPSVEEFDDMLSKASKGSKGSKKNLFSRKQFG
jgi:hypothetical protein